MKRLIFVLVVGLAVSFGLTADGYVASSPSYRLESDTVNSAGTDSGSSASYGLIDSIGQLVSGLFSGPNYYTNAGYRQATVVVTPGGGGGGGGGGGCVGPNCPQIKTLVPNVSNFEATYNSVTGKIDLTWQNPTFTQFSAVRIMRMTAPNISGSPLEGILVYDGPGQSAVDSDVNFDTTYFYTAFVRDNSTPANYSSGAVDSAAVPPEDVELPVTPILPPPCDNCDVFDVFLKGQSSSNLTLGDFQFIQNDERVQFFAGGETISVDSSKDLTILLPYDKAPASLKIIGVTVFDSAGGSKSFSFILRANQQKTAYLATIGRLAEGSYPFKIHLIDYTDRSIKILSGTLYVRHGQSVLSVFGSVGEVGSKVLLGAGIVAAILHLIFSAGTVNSFTDLYLLAVRFIGSLLGAFGLRKKRIPWGTVYDAVTKRPLDPAYVSLLQMGNEVASAITDIDGRYGFFVNQGTYILSAGKTHYTFPSTTLAGKTQDELYDNLYFGEQFIATSGQVINRNIPMDPIGFDWNEFAKTKKDFFQVHSKKIIIRDQVFNVVFALGLLLALGEMVFLPSIINLSIFGLYLFLVVVQLFWVAGYKVVSLKNLRTSEPLSFAIVKVYLPGSDQLIRKVVADEFGRFYVLVPPGEYYLTVEEKLADQTYNLIYKSEPMKLKKGVIDKDVVIA